VDFGPFCHKICYGVNRVISKPFQIDDTHKTAKYFNHLKAIDITVSALCCVVVLFQSKCIYAILSYFTALCEWNK